MRKMFLAALAAACFATAAIANPISFTLAVDLHGTLDDAPFNGQFFRPATFTGNADTADIFDDGSGILFVPLSALTMVSDGTIFHITSPSWFAVNPEYGIGGIVFNDTSALEALTGMDFTDYPTFTGYHLDASFDPTLVQAFWATATVQTDQGTLVIDGSEDTVFSATLASAAVPEMASWTMMIAGFGLIGWVARRSRMPAAA